MSIHIVIDGYNLIRQSHTLSAFELEDMQLGREALVDMLSAYKKVKRHRITVVFDGKNAPSLYPYRDHLKGIEVVFSRDGETADAVIKRISERERQKALVVSSDREIVDYAVLQGAATISSPDFEKKIGASVYGAAQDMTVEDALKPAWDGSTKKKGPRRRRSKKDRHRRVRLRKL